MVVFYPFCVLGGDFVGQDKSFGVYELLWIAITNSILKQTHVHVYASVHVCTHTYTRTHTHIHDTHTHIHAHTYIDVFQFKFGQWHHGLHHLTNMSRGTKCMEVSIVLMKSVCVDMVSITCTGEEAVAVVVVFMCWKREVHVSSKLCVEGRRSPCSLCAVEDRSAS